MYIVSLNYKVPAKVIAEHQAAHTAFMKEHTIHGTFLLSGPRELKIGEIILARAESKKALETLLENDPFKANGVADFKVMEFTPALSGKKLTFLIDKEEE